MLSSDKSRYCGILSSSFVASTSRCFVILLRFLGGSVGLSLSECAVEGGVLQPISRGVSGLGVLPSDDKSDDEHEGDG